MFYTALINALRSDSNIANTVSTYNNNPAIFSNEAPENAVMPYIIIDIDNHPNADSVMIRSDVYINYWDKNKPRMVADQAAIAITNRLDTMRLVSDVVTDIRFTEMSSGYVNNPDPRIIHYNITFTTRAARSKWMGDTL